MFAIGTIYAHTRSVEPNVGETRAAWLEAAGVDDGETCDASARIELVERLALVAEPWCIDALRAATKQERDPRVRKAINSALRSLR